MQAWPRTSDGPPPAPITQAPRCEDNGMRRPLFSLPVCATNARLDTGQQEASVCLQALLGGGSSHGEGNSRGGNLARLGKHRKGKHSQSSPVAGAGTQECKARANHLSVPLSPPDVLRFDNTYSFVHTKKISFTVEVLLPDKGMQKYDEELTPI